MDRRAHDYIAAADVLRVISIGLIGWYHIWQQSWLAPGFRAGSHYVNLEGVIRHGYLPVDIVLVISGFLLAIPHARVHLGQGGRPSWHSYYVKRFWRIVPSYVLAIMLCLFLWVLPRGQYASPEFMAKDLLAHLTFTHDLFYDTYFFTPLPIVLWTMGVEVQFYVVFPIVARLYERSPSLTCLWLALAAAVFRLWVYAKSDTTFWVNQLPAMLDLYAAGMFAAYAYVKLSKRSLGVGARCLCALAALLSLLIILQIMYYAPTGDYELIRHEQLSMRLPLGLCAGVFLVCGGLAPPLLNRLLGNPLTRSLAAISYNFYIWHQTLAVWLKQLHIPDYVSELPNQAGEQPWQTQYTLVCFGAAILAAAAITYLWERPLYRLGTKRLR